jgi:hypothetical protein
MLGKHVHILADYFLNRLIICYFYNHYVLKIKYLSYAVTMF